jgi:hypothetical protein
MINKHLEHVEDLLFTEEDPLVPLQILEKTFQFLCGDVVDDYTISTKWDGSPAFICGKDPENGKFFLGTKSVFSGKVNYDYGDIVKNHEDIGLRRKLQHLYSRLKYYPWSGIYQGDLLWNGIEGYYLTGENQFKPNILKYKIPSNGIFSFLGVVFHTKYSGTKLSKLEASLVSKSPIEYPNTLYLSVINPSIKSLKEPIVSELEINKVSDLNYALEFIKYLPIDVLKEFQTNKKLLALFHKYRNILIKFRTPTSVNHLAFINFLKEEFAIHRFVLKTQKGKLKCDAELDNILKILNPFYLDLIFEYYFLLDTIKLRLVSYLDRLDTTTKIELPDGTICGHEGYVVEYKGTLCKLVNRNIFSRYNFNTVKDWQV